jgi:PAS domain-containing protein
MRGRTLVECEVALRWLAAVFDQSPVGKLLVHAPDGRIEMNQAARKMTGRTIENIARFPSDMIAKVERSRAQAALRRDPSERDTARQDGFRIELSL